MAEVSDWVLDRPKVNYFKMERIILQLHWILSITMIKITNTFIYKSN